MNGQRLPLKFSFDLWIQSLGRDSLKWSSLTVKLNTLHAKVNLRGCYYTTYIALQFNFTAHKCNSVGG